MSIKVLSLNIFQVLVTYNMKFMSLEWMLLKPGKKVRPVLKIPLNSTEIKTVRIYKRCNIDFTGFYKDVMHIVAQCNTTMSYKNIVK